LATKAAACRRLPKHERLSRPAAWEPIVGSVKESNEERMPIGPEFDRCHHEVRESGGLFISSRWRPRCAGRGSQRTLAANSQPSMNERSHKREPRGFPRSSGWRIACRFADDVARTRSRETVKSAAARTLRRRAKAPGCPNRQRFSAMLAESWVEICGAEIIGNAEGAAACSGALTGMLYRADVE
jgi:hypothetical protein